MPTDDEIWEKLAKAKAAGAEYDTNQTRTFSQCLDGTRVDLLNELCARMEADDRRVVWLFGEAGSGKSSAAYTVADRLRNNGHLAATFFFSLKHTDLNDTSLVYLTLAYQIGNLHHLAREAIIKAIKRDPELLSKAKSHKEQLKRLVIEPLRALRYRPDVPQSIILDAADEGGSRIKTTILALAELVRDPTIPVSHILVTSRPYPPFMTLAGSRELTGLVSPIHIEDFNPTQDIQLFLQHSFDEIYDSCDLYLSQTKPWPSEDILNSLSCGIRGRFIVAATIVRLVGADERPCDRLRLVSSMYDGSINAINLALDNIDSLYRYILSDCRPEERQLGLECLSDIIALREPMHTSDICKLFGYDIRKRIGHLSAIICVPPTDSREPVTTYHTSLRDYLWDRSRSQDLHVSPVSSQARLLCMMFRFGINNVDNRAHDFDPYYIFCNWWYYLAYVEPTEDIQALLIPFLKTCLVYFVDEDICRRHLYQLTDTIKDAGMSYIKARTTILSWKPFTGQNEAASLLDSALKLFQFGTKIKEVMSTELCISCYEITPRSSYEIRHEAYCTSYVRLTKHRCLYPGCEYECWSLAHIYEHQFGEHDTEPCSGDKWIDTGIPDPDTSRHRHRHRLIRFPFKVYIGDYPFYMRCGADLDQNTEAVRLTRSTIPAMFVTFCQANTTGSSAEGVSVEVGQLQDLYAQWADYVKRTKREGRSENSHDIWLLCAWVIWSSSR